MGGYRQDRYDAVDNNDDDDDANSERIMSNLPSAWNGVRKCFQAQLSLQTAGYSEVDCFSCFLSYVYPIYSSYVTWPCPFEGGLLE